MKKLIVRILLSIIAIITLSSCKKEQDQIPDSNAKVRNSLTEKDTLHVAIYKGEASCQDCAETVKSAIEQTGIKCHIDFVGPGEKIDITENTLIKYDILVQPGGGQDIAGAFRSLGQQRARAIHDYVSKSGGHYLGLCMGAYLAGDSYLGLIEEDLDSEVGRPGFPVKTIEDSAIVVNWNGLKQNIFFQDGPYLPARNGDSKFLKIATYENGDLAAARYTKGLGVVILTGPHPEASKLWYENADLPLSKMPTRDLIKDILSYFYQ